MRGAAAYAGAATLLSSYMLGLDPLAQCMRSLEASTPWMGDAAALAIVVVAAAALRASRLRRLPAGTPRGRYGRHAAAAACTALALLGLAALALRLLDPGFDEREFALRGLGDARAFRHLLLLAPFVVAAEELVFRTCQDWLRPALGSTVSCGVIASAFALHHLEIGRGIGAHEAVILLATGVGGAVLAALYESAPSVALVAAIHLTYDLLALAQAWLNVNGPAAGETALFAGWILAPGMAGLWLGWRDGWTIRAIHAENSPAPRWIRALAAVAFGILLPALMSFLRSLL